MLSSDTVWERRTSSSSSTRYIRNVPPKFVDPSSAKRQMLFKENRRKTPLPALNVSFKMELPEYTKIKRHFPIPIGQPNTPVLPLRTKKFPALRAKPETAEPPLSQSSVQTVPLPVANPVYGIIDSLRTFEELLQKEQQVTLSQSSVQTVPLTPSAMVVVPAPAPSSTRKTFSETILTPLFNNPTTFTSYLEFKKQLEEKEKSFHFRDDGIFARIEQIKLQDAESKPMELDDTLEIESEDPRKQIIAQLLQARKEPVSESEKQTVRNHLRAATTSQEVLIDKFNIDMTREKFSCLRHATWLNDEVINFYMQLLQQKDDSFVAEKKKPKSSHYFNSFFFTKLLENDKYTYANVKRWTKKFDIFQKEKIFIPINLQNTHWTMLVVYIEKKEIHYYDSMSGSGRLYLQSALQWIADEAKEKKNQILNKEEWKLIDRERHVPQQRNGFDCGMFSIYCADYITDDLPLKYCQDEMAENRIRVGAAILRGKLNY